MEGDVNGEVLEVRSDGIHEKLDAIAARLDSVAPRNGASQAALEMPEGRSEAVIKAKLTKAQYLKILSIQAAHKERTGRKAHIQDIAANLIDMALRAVDLVEGRF